MVSRVSSVTFQGIDVRNVDVQVQITNGMPAFAIVGLPDKAVGESKERVRSALHAMGLTLPSKHITVNLAPADLAKEGPHYDLPIVLGLLAEMEVIPKEELSEYCALGELALDATIHPVAGVLPAAVHAAGKGLKLVCPEASAAEATWAGDVDIIAPGDILQLINHLKGLQVISAPAPQSTLTAANQNTGPDMASVKGQEGAKRALEIAAAGGHSMLMSGPPGSGKSMLASCMPGILPPLSAREALDVSMIHSLAGLLPEGGLVSTRPFRDPHHSASLPALVGGGIRVKPGEISLAHHGVLFLDEIPEFNRATLESMRQPLETGQALIARANQHVTFPAQFQLIAAMNPCRCGYLGDVDRECNRAPRCGIDYQAKLSGPFLDRIDIRLDVQPVPITELDSIAPGEASDNVRARVQAARDIQTQRYQALHKDITLNAHASAELLENIAPMAPEAREILAQAAEKLKLSARGYHRVIRVARTIADLDGGPETLAKPHIAEALTYR